MKNGIVDNIYKYINIYIYKRRIGIRIRITYSKNQSLTILTVNSLVASILTWVSFKEPSGFLWTVTEIIGGFGQIKLQKANGATLATPSADIVEIKLVVLCNFYINTNIFFIIFIIIK